LVGGFIVQISPPYLISVFSGPLIISDIPFGSLCEIFNGCFDVFDSKIIIFFPYNRIST